MIIITNELQHAIVLFWISADCVYVLWTLYLWSFWVEANQYVMFRYLLLWLSIHSSLMLYGVCLWCIEYVRVVRVKITITARLMNFSFSTNLYVSRINISVVFKLQMAELCHFRNYLQGGIRRVAANYCNRFVSHFELFSFTGC